MSVIFFNDTATTEIYTLSLHDALPICMSGRVSSLQFAIAVVGFMTVRTMATVALTDLDDETRLDRKSTRLNSSHANISYAVFCLKKKLYTALARPRLPHATPRLYSTLF